MRLTYLVSKIRWTSQRVTVLFVGSYPFMCVTYDLPIFTRAHSPCELLAKQSMQTALFVEVNYLGLNIYNSFLSFSELI